MRSWLSISALALLFVFGCCGQKGAKDGTTDGNKDRTEAPKHNAPDQDRIDSLKKEKEKGKL